MYSKKIFILFLTIFLCRSISGEDSSLNYLINSDLGTENKNNQFIQYNFGPVFSEKDSVFNFGFIGDGFKRIRIKFISVIRNPKQLDLYYVYGKSNVLGNICEFQGTLEIDEIRIYNTMHLGCDDEYKGEIKIQGVLIAKYNLYENPNQKYSGYFTGIVYSAWYIDKNNQIMYDFIEEYSDSWCNNQFIGKWFSYGTGESKICNWGDGRVPESGDLDIGVGEFIPNKKYWDVGWKSYYQAWWEYPRTEKNDEAETIERYEWWK